MVRQPSEKRSRFFLFRVLIFENPRQSRLHVRLILTSYYCDKILDFAFAVNIQSVKSTELPASEFVKENFHEMKSVVQVGDRSNESQFEQQTHTFG